MTHLPQLRTASMILYRKLHVIYQKLYNPVFLIFKRKELKK